MKGFVAFLASLYRKFDKSSRGIEVQHRSTIPSRYSGPKRRMYEKANADIDANGFHQRIFYPAMVKWGERNARPRAIIPHAFRALGSTETKPGEILLGPILVELPFRLLIEEALHKLRNFDGTRMVASGLTLQKRARCIKKMHRVGWTCLSLDASSYDGSQGFLATTEEDMCLNFFRERGDDVSELERCLQSQKNLNIESGDLKANIRGNRASGTGGTSSANKVVMLAALMWSCGRSYRENKILFFCDGDDTLVFVHPDAQPFIGSWMRRMGELGLEIKVEGVATTYTEVVFCRSKIVETVEGPMMCKMPHDAFKTQSCIVRHFRGNELGEYLSTLHTGFKNTWRGLPVLSVLGDMFPPSKSTKSALLSSSGMERWMTDTSRQTQSVPITQAARDSYFIAFGTPPSVQIEIENCFREIGAQMPSALDEYLRTRRTGINLSY